MKNTYQSQAKLFGNPLRTPPKDAETISHKYLAQGGFVHQLASGIFSLLPMGLMVNMKIANIIREELNKLGAQELLMPSLQPKSIWEESGRWDKIDPPLFILKDRHNKELCIAPTHEEAVTNLARTFINSYKQLPLAVYQIQTKFRNEQRATGGLLRVREFIMKDLYSFHTNEEDLANFYNKVKQAYLRIFSRCGLEVIPIAADPGTIGGSVTHEFTLIAPTGEDKIAICEKCGFAANIEAVKGDKCPQCDTTLIYKTGIESGHIFQLGTRYSEKMHAFYTNDNGEQKPLVMGCYGIGVGRLLAAIVEAQHDEKGIIWPKAVAPYDVHVIGLKDAEAEKIAQEIADAGYDVLFDDRDDASAGEKFADSELIGIPIQVIVSERGAKEGIVEIRPRTNLKDSRKVSRDGTAILEELKNILKSENV